VLTDFSLHVTVRYFDMLSNGSRRHPASNPTRGMARVPRAARHGRTPFGVELTACVP
jgi:hypothetical protein